MCLLKCVLPCQYSIWRVHSNNLRLEKTVNNSCNSWLVDYCEHLMRAAIVSSGDEMTLEYKDDISEGDLLIVCRVCVCIVTLLLCRAMRECSLSLFKEVRSFKSKVELFVMRH